MNLTERYVIHKVYNKTKKRKQKNKYFKIKVIEYLS